MCGGVRGVGTGGIVSSTFCLLFKLFTLKLTEKQVYALINHTDSAYIRALGFMFIRYCQHPNTFWEWFEPYLEDDEEVDPKVKHLLDERSSPSGSTHWEKFEIVGIYQGM